jgi:pimeloyl-ACP methyl ester carboxylesterase
MKNNETPISFSELNAEPQLNITNNKYFKASDNTNLAYYEYQTDKTPEHILLFIHGGGACSCLGYQYLAETLSTKYNTKVYLFDMRGHGLSEGKRGDSPTTKRVWQDISEFIRFIKSENSNISIFLGGHSSGGGLVLNYATWKEREDINGYVFISPKLGYKSNTDRHNFTDDPFAKAHILTIIINKLSNGTLNAHSLAVEMNYSQEAQHEQPLLVDKYTCTVVNAITPNDPQKQFSTIDKPFCIFIGDQDELMIPNNTIKYLTFSNKKIQSKSKAEIVQNQKHLGILRVAGNLIGEYLTQYNTNY